MMLTYLATLAELAACRLRILARALGSPSEQIERTSAVIALDLLFAKLASAPGMPTSGLPPRFVVETRKSAKQQVSYIAQGALDEGDVLGWASAWTEWVQSVDERARARAARASRVEARAKESKGDE